jgi:hypothetical protein
MSTQFTFDPASLALFLVIPIGIIIVIYIALRKYFETRGTGFLSIALAFISIHVYIPLTSLLMHFVDFRVTIWTYPVVFALFFALVAYGLLRLSSKPQIGTELPSGGKLSLTRQLSLLAGVAMIVAVFYTWIVYDYTHYGGGAGGSLYLLDVFLLPSRLRLEQINLTTLAIGAIFTSILLLVAGLGCIVKDAKWSMLGVAGLIAFFIVYVGSSGAHLIVATGSYSYGGGAVGWQMALSLGPVVGTLGVATGLAALILSIAGARTPSKVGEIGSKTIPS